MPRLIDGLNLAERSFVFHCKCGCTLYECDETRKKRHLSTLKHQMMIQGATLADFNYYQRQKWNLSYNRREIYSSTTGELTQKSMKVEMSRIEQFLEDMGAKYNIDDPWLSKETAKPPVKTKTPRSARGSQTPRFCDFATNPNVSYWMRKLNASKENIIPELHRRGFDYSKLWKLRNADLIELLIKFDQSR